MRAATSSRSAPCSTRWSAARAPFDGGLAAPSIVAAILERQPPPLADAAAAHAAGARTPRRDVPGEGPQRPLAVVARFTTRASLAARRQTFARRSAARVNRTRRGWTFKWAAAAAAALVLAAAVYACVPLASAAATPSSLHSPCRRRPTPLFRAAPRKCRCRRMAACWRLSR